MPPADPSVLTDASALPAPARSWLWWPLETLAATGAFAYWGIFGLLFTLAALPLCLALPKRKAEVLGRSLLHRAFRIFVRYLRLTGLVYADLDSLKPLRQRRDPVIIAPNHTSLWDAVFVIACLPQPICIMKESILCNPFLGGGARLAGYIPNGSSSRLVREASEALTRGGQLLLFPEGTRTRHDARWINPLKGGCALIARHAQVPVLPIYIRSNTRFLEKGWPLWKRPEFPIRMSFELGEEQSPQEGESAKDFTQRLEAEYQAHLSRPHKLRRQVAE
ncbi:1-acyl-sn-glycerol-3-phosphate acyltransferase [Haloferula luteola]|uniref:1-acyl-sn-glycerol-3-phosphate acyltransferase n=1 Tax=Haloferula luteola TaxID=595692 RepID=A0A840V2Y9_9BACT|nr:lysophospholipid acyltransferase family protein [Haloferula luteola]MBB5351416.1 1-acyl-sn-glycerol-3-phosphate acyltransferase [Haloferula luteola]